MGSVFLSVSLDCQNIVFLNRCLKDECIFIYRKLENTAILFNNGDDAFDAKTMTGKMTCRNPVNKHRLLCIGVADIQTKLFVFDIYTTGNPSLLRVKDVLACMQCILKTVG